MKRFSTSRDVDEPPASPSSAVPSNVSGSASREPATTTTTRATAAIVESQTSRATSNSPLERDDWAEDLPNSDHVQFFKSSDWASSILGPLSTWDIALRMQTFIIMADTRPATLYWGPRKAVIYNEGFVPLVGNKHPDLMGSTFEDSFPEIADEINERFAYAETNALAADVTEIPLFLERAGFLEEAFLTGTFIPVRGLSGKVEGFYNSVVEITTAKLHARRREVLDSMEILSSRLDEPFASYIIPPLEQNALDIPMALLYEVDEESSPGESILHLRGKIGIPDNHPLSTKVTKLSGSEGIIPLLRSSREEITTVPTTKDFDGINWGGFGEPSRMISILPLMISRRLFGFLLVGTNPRQSINEHHHRFMRDMASKASAVAAALVSADEARMRADRLERELADSERQIRYMAQHASVGMQHLSTDGVTVWANEQYYNMTGHSRELRALVKFSFLEVFIDEDRPKALDAWNLLLQGEHNVSAELRLKRLFTPPTGDPEPACILSLSFPYAEEGKIKSIMTCMTDVSSLKWAEASEARNAAEAREAKRQQEEFIDLVSHELRNPLSAIFQLADTIINSFPAGEAAESPTGNPLHDILRSNIEAASTILMCAKHQKRIVDDVLTLSKLEYMMLAIAPRPVQLPKLIDRSVRMFDADMTEADIKVTVGTDSSLQEHKIDWIMCDPSRVTQIFINLLTNAIKFTKTEDRRRIAIRYGVTLSDPRDSFKQEFAWAPNQQQIADVTLAEDWGRGEPLFVTLKVTDTGVGMTPEQITKLFSRFQQASARTSIKYGGTGLGLFISQKLTEKLGGEIGVVSEAGKGSTFAFYFKARRTTKEMKKSAEQVVRPVLTSRSTSGTVITGIPEIDLSRMHVLLVEDNAVNQQILKQQLSKEGCVVFVANHGGEALDFIKKTNAWSERGETAKHLDIILMDWQMPVMDGLTACREIRRLQKEGQITRHLEIIATTASAREEQIEVALASGMDDVLSKPFRVADLLDLMRERLSKTISKNTSPRIWTSP